MNLYTFQNDIALVKVKIVPNQQVIKVANKMPSKNDECLIYGYGSSDWHTNTVTSDVIRYGSVNLISFEQCEEILGRVTAPSEGTGQFCAMGKQLGSSGGSGVDACNGE
jgi:hypothetical protein